ncbi:hypothetical protein MP228_006762 [Amoeboaphelidium protococcarum]|nr:hypothetical protein MP228_006762 [Amoeboaphelidium protococcarum]
MSARVKLFSKVPLAAPDPIFHLNAQYKACTSPLKINLGIGAYRNNEGKPWVLPAVKMAEKKIVDSIMKDQLDHEYLPIEGSEKFCEFSSKFILGENSPMKVAAVQALSGTGALRVGAVFLERYRKATVYVSNPTWGNHNNIFKDAGLDVKQYRYWDDKNNKLDINGMLQDIQSAPDGSIILLHSCAHNPCGIDPTQAEWKSIAEVIKKKQHLSFFDSAYQGFASGDLDKDAYSVRLFTREYGLEVMIAQSYSKNFGLYNERVGCLVVAHSGDDDTSKAIKSQLARIARPMYSNPPAHGCRIVTTVLSDPELYKEWSNNVKTMAGRINKMRHRVVEELKNLGTPGDWSHVTTQIGMFSYTGLKKEQVALMKEKFHVYLSDNGRISIAGLNDSNVAHFAKAIDYAVKNTQKSNL